MITWDHLALLCAVLAVLMRLFDHPQLGGALSSLCLFFATLGQRAANRRKEAALASPAGRPVDRAAPAVDAA